MLPDPMYVPGAISQDIAFATPKECRVVSNAKDTPGRTVRTLTIGSLTAELIISNSETKENKPYGTKRSQIRINLYKLDAAGLPVNGFVQIVHGLPKAVITKAELDEVRSILAALLHGGNCAVDSTTGASAGGTSFFARLAAGEE